MKIGWGTGIVIVLVLFATMMLTFLVKSFTKEHQLVTENYYEQELVYQDRIDDLNRAKREEIDVQVKQANGAMAVGFSDGKRRTQGQFFFKRPADSKYDLIIEIQTDSTGMQLLNRNEFIRGKYEFSAKWVDEGRSFQISKSVFIQ